MALSNAEKVRRYRERQKAKKAEELKRPTELTNDFKRPFFEFFTLDDQTGSSYCQNLELCGIEPLFFEDDTGPEVSTLDDLTDPMEPTGKSNPFGSSQGTSLGKAEVIIGCLLEAAQDLAYQVNAYKKSELKARIAELEESDLADEAARKEAIAKIAVLTKKISDLEKSVRFQFPVWKTEMANG